MYNTDNEFSVKVYHKKISLNKHGLFGLALECFSCAYSKEKTNTTFFFRVESDAMEFVEILQLHSVQSQNIAPK